MFPVPNSVSCDRPAQRTKGGFTLIELILVIAVIMVLSGITFGIARGVQNAQARAAAKAELAVIAQALEGYKSTHGDYPWAADSEALAKALMGWMAFSGSGSSMTFVTVNSADVPTSGPKNFIDPTKLDYSGSLPDAANEEPGSGAFLDPWGNPYVYKYKTSAADSWEVFGFHLYSVGENGTDGTTTAATGVMTRPAGEDDADNIYAGE